MENTIQKIISYLISFLNILKKPVELFNDNYPKFIFILYLLRIIYLISAVVIGILTFTGTISRGILFHLYSVLKIIFLLFLLLISFVIVILLFFKLNKCDSDNLPSLEVQILSSISKFTPYVYDIFATLILLGIIKACYIKSCSSENLKPNVYAFIDFIVWGIPILIILLCIILSFVASKFIKNANIFKNITNPFLSVYISLLIIYLVLQYIEELIANNFAYWLKLNDNATSGTNCVTDDTGDEDGFDFVANIFISILLGLMVIFVFIIQLIPFFGIPNINDLVRNFIKTASTSISGMLEPNCQQNVSIQRHVGGKCKKK